MGDRCRILNGSRGGGKLDSGGICGPPDVPGIEFSLYFTTALGVIADGTQETTSIEEPQVLVLSSLYPVN